MEHQNLKGSKILIAATDEKFLKLLLGELRGQGAEVILTTFLASNPHELIAKIQQEKPAALLIHTPGLSRDSSVKACSAVLNSVKHIPVCIHDSLDKTHPALLQLVKGGAYYLHPDSQPEQIAYALSDAIVKQGQPGFNRGNEEK